MDTEKTHVKMTNLRKVKIIGYLNPKLIIAEKISILRLSLLYDPTGKLTSAEKDRKDREGHMQRLCKA